jgi:hypothetical protein
MKVAICYSGMLRGFEDFIQNHIDYLISKHDCDIYLNFWDVFGYGLQPYSKYTTKNHYRFTGFHGENKSKIEIVPIIESDLIDDGTKNRIIEKLKPKDYIFDSFSTMEPFFQEKEKYFINKWEIKIEDGVQFPVLLMMNVMGMYYRIYKCGEMVKNSGIEYDVVLRNRTDTLFTDNVILQKPEKNTIYTNSIQSWTEAVNDTFLYGDMDVMFNYHKLYLNLFSMWEEIPVWNSSEHFLYKYLIKNNININSDFTMSTHSEGSYKIKKIK